MRPCAPSAIYATDMRSQAKVRRGEPIIDADHWCHWQAFLALSHRCRNFGADARMFRPDYRGSDTAYRHQLAQPCRQSRLQQAARHDQSLPLCQW